MLCKVEPNGIEPSFTVDADAGLNLNNKGTLESPGCSLTESEPPKLSLIKNLFYELVGVAIRTFHFGQFTVSVRASAFEVHIVTYIN